MGLCCILQLAVTPRVKLLKTTKITVLIYSFRWVNVTEAPSDFVNSLPLMVNLLYGLYCASLCCLVELPFQFEHPQDRAHRTLEEKINSLGDKLASLSHQQSEVRHSTPHYLPIPEVTLWREFKINGQIGEGGQKDKLSYTSLIHQIDSGFRKGYSEAEIVEAVIRAVTPGLHLQCMLKIKSGFTLSVPKPILKGHYMEENTTDLYHRLTNISLEPKESP